MFKRVTMLFAGLMLCAAAAWAQVTIPAVTELQFYSGGLGVIRAYSPAPYIGAKNMVGAPMNYVTFNANYDSVASQHWRVTVERRLTHTSGDLTRSLEISIRGFNIEQPQIVLEYRDTVNYNDPDSFQIQIPDDEKVRRAQNGIFPFLRDSLFTWVPNYGTANPGDEAEWIINRYVPVNADSLGRLLLRWADVRISAVDSALAVYSYPGLDSLTIDAADTINRLADTTYTSAFPGRRSYYTLLETLVERNANDVPQHGLGYQLKFIGSNWGGPLGTTSQRIYVLADSVVGLSAYAATSDSIKFYGFTLNSPADSLRMAGLADSLRIARWGKSAADSTVIRATKIFYRD